MTGKDNTQASAGMQVLTVTIANPAANIRCGAAGTTDADGAELFTNRSCRTCLIQQTTGTGGYMAVGRAATAAATSWKVPAAPYAHEIQIDDVAKLNFIGTATDVIQILVRF